MKRVSEEEIEAVLEVLRRDPVCLSGYYKNPRGGPSVQQFEEALARYHGIKHAICVSNGTSALHVALMACGVQPGDKVITTPLTFSATATSILMCGAEPLFVDVDSRTYNISPEKIDEAMGRDVKAIIPVHLLGTPCDMDPLMDIADGDVFVIEDNAQALGARYKSKLTGTFGDLSILSFQETKVITAGEGGAVLTNNDEMAEECRYLRNHGQQYGLVDYLCWNYRMTEIQAALGLVQLKKLDEFNRIQVENAKILFEHLPAEIHPPYIPDYAEPTLYIIGCLADDGFPREELVKRLTEKGINKNLPGSTVGLGYQRTIMELPLLKPYKRPCPIAEELVKHFIWFDSTRFRTSKEFMENDLKVILEVFKADEGEGKRRES